MNTIQAIQELCQYDHLLLEPKIVMGIYKPFHALGVEGKINLYVDNRSEPKGLRLRWPYQEGDYAEGLNSEELAMDIADQLGIRYVECYGKGAQLRAACEAILEFLEKRKTSSKKKASV